MTDRLEAAVAELVAALRDEVAAATPTHGPERLLSIAEACEALGGVARSTIYQELAAGRVRSIKVGRRRLIPASAIAERVTS